MFKRLLLVLSVAVLPFSCALTQSVGRIGNGVPSGSGNTDPTTLPLFSSNPFVYDCGWNIPNGYNVEDSATISPGIDSANNTMYFQNRFEQFMEVSIPACDPTPPGWTAMSTVLQTPVDITNGQLGNPGTLIPMGANETMAGGILVWNNQLIITGTPFYDMGQVNVFFRKPTLTLATNDIIGARPVSGSNVHYVTGAMGIFPSNWAAVFGQCCFVVESTHGVISTTSYGNAFATFDPSTITGGGSVTTLGLMYHDGDHQLNSHPTPGTNPSTWATGGWHGLYPFPDLDSSTWASFSTDAAVYDNAGEDCGEREADGTFNASSPPSMVCYGTFIANTAGPGASSIWFNEGLQVAGAVIAPHHRSLLFVERMGTGQYCYGNPKRTPDLGGAECIDPTDGDHGIHTYPYRYQVKAFDLNDLLAVKNSSANPQIIQPYGVWDLPLDGVGDNGQTVELWNLGMGCDTKTPITCYFAVRKRGIAGSGAPLIQQMHIVD